MKIERQIARFQIRRQIGAGAFGIVYLADDPVLDRPVALKVMQQDAPGGSAAGTRFLREAKAAARLNHPQIVPVFDAGTDGERYFIASAYVAGETLEEEIEHGAPDLRRAAWICQQLAAALHYAHQSGIVHRDVKSGNVMVDSAGDVHLMDFGLAQVIGSDERLTHDDALIGTAAYMAPEQASREFGEVGPRSDQYSLGVVLYELLCEQVPFCGPPAVVLYNVVNTDPVPPRSVVPSIPRDLETICLKAMTKRPQGRYLDCGQLAEDLRRWLAGEAITARRAGPVERLAKWIQRNPILASLVGVVVTLLLFTAIVPSVGYRVVAQRVEDTEREEGGKKGLELKIAKTTRELKNLEPKIDDLESKKSELSKERDALRKVSQGLIDELNRIRDKDPIEVLLEELRRIVESADMMPEPMLLPERREPERAPPVATVPDGKPTPRAPAPSAIESEDPIAAHVPEEYIYARFTSPGTLQRLMQATDELATGLGAKVGRSSLQTELESLQFELCLPDMASQSDLADGLIAGLAIIKTGLSTRLVGAGIGIVVQEADGADGRLLGFAIRRQRKQALLQLSGVAAERTVTIGGCDVSLIASNNGRGLVHSYYVSDGDIHLITNSASIVSGFLRAGRGERPISSTAGFQVAQQMLRRVSEPHAMLLVPSEFWSTRPELSGLGPLVGVISQINSAPDSLRSLVYEVEVPSPWIEFLLLQTRPIEYGNILVSVYRQLAQHSPDTRFAPLPGDSSFLEIAITDTCRVFGGLRLTGSYYFGIAETEVLLDILKKLLAQPEFEGEDIRRVRDGLDLQDLSLLPFSGIRRRVFNGDWVAGSPDEAVLEEVTPKLKIESAARQATVRLRMNVMAAAAALGRSLNNGRAAIPSTLKTFNALELSLAADSKRLLAYGKIDWTGTVATQLTPSHQQTPDWRRLETLLQNHSRPMKATEPAILLTIERLCEQVGADTSSEEALVTLFELEKVLLTLHTPERDPQLRLVQERKEILLVQKRKEILLDQIFKRLDEVPAGSEKLSALFEIPSTLPMSNPAVRLRFQAELTNTSEWIEELDYSLQNAQELAKIDELLDKSNPDQEPVARQVETKRIAMIERLVDELLWDFNLGRSPAFRQVRDLTQLLPNTERGQQARLRINETWRERFGEQDD